MHKFLYYCFCFSFILLSSCKDKKNVSEDLPPQLNAIYDQLKSEPQTFKIQAGQYSSIIGQHGTIITFTPNSFVDNDNNIVTDGILDVELTEMYTIAALLQNRVFMITENNEWLESSGAVHIKVLKRGNVLLANNYKIAFKEHVNNASSKSLFNGFNIPMVGGFTTIWNIDSINTASITPLQDTIGNTNYYYVYDSVAYFGNLNCGSLVDFTGERTNIKVVVPTINYSNKNTEVLIHVDGLNAILPLNAYNKEKNTFSFTNDNLHLPIGTTIDIIVLYEKNGLYRKFVANNIVLTPHLEIFADMQDASIDEIKQSIEGL